MLKQVCRRHMTRIQNDLFATHLVAQDGIDQAYYLIEHLKCKEDKAPAYTALHIVINSIAQEVIEFIDDDI